MTLIEFKRSITFHSYKDTVHIIFHWKSRVLVQCKFSEFKSAKRLWVCLVDNQVRIRRLLWGEKKRMLIQQMDFLTSISLGKKVWNVTERHLPFLFLFFFFLFSLFFIRYFLYLHFKCYPLPGFSLWKPIHSSPPAHQPTHSCFLALAFPYTGA